MDLTEWFALRPLASDLWKTLILDGSYHLIRSVSSALASSISFYNVIHTSPPANYMTNIHCLVKKLELQSPQFYFLIHKAWSVVPVSLLAAYTNVVFESSSTRPHVPVVVLFCYCPVDVAN